MDTGKAAQILTAGEILAEIMTVADDQPLNAPGELAGPFPSGAPAIFADSAAKIGGDVGIISCVGKDAFGALCLSRLKSDGVDVSGVQVDPQKTTGTAFVTYRSDGEREFLFHFAEAAAGNIRLSERDEERLRRCRYFHVMGCSITGSDANARAIARAVRIAAGNGAVVSFDPNIRRELPLTETARQATEQVLAAASILLSGKEELCWLSGRDTPDGAAAFFLDGGADIVVLKNGAGPVRLLTRGEELVCPSRSFGKAVDPTGAGDCFDGAFIAAVSQGRPYGEALRIATAAGGLSVLKKGPMEGAATLRQVEQALSER